MASVRRDHDDVTRLEFVARIARVGMHGGHPALELEETWFYPEGGGQLADRGRIGPARVLDVQPDRDGSIWHVVDALPEGRELPAVIDAARRFDHMQQHSGQHVLSAALERVRGAATLSSTLGAERSVIEVALPDSDWQCVREIETAANAVVWDDRDVRLHWTDAEGVGAFGLRKPPSVTGRIRIVEIADWDTSACGGTHVRTTGQIGVIKITGWEKVRGHVRFEFLCGARSLSDHAWRVEVLREGARRRTVSERDLVASLERLADERTVLARELESVRRAALEGEARAAVTASGRLADWSPARSREDVRRLVILAIEAGARWAVAGAAAPVPVLVIARPRGTAPDLREWLPELLARARGKGGGSPELLTLAPADSAAAHATHDWACTAFAALPGD